MNNDMIHLAASTLGTTVVEGSVETQTITIAS